jgi:hypothetical protein
VFLRVRLRLTLRNTPERYLTLIETGPKNRGRSLLAGVNRWSVEASDWSRASVRMLQIRPVIDVETVTLKITEGLNGEKQEFIFRDIPTPTVGAGLATQVEEPAREEVEISPLLVSIQEAMDADGSAPLGENVIMHAQRSDIDASGTLSLWQVSFQARGDSDRTPELPQFHLMAYGDELTGVLTPQGSAPWGDVKAVFDVLAMADDVVASIGMDIPPQSDVPDSPDD